MANPEHLKILKREVDAWNNWRLEHEDVIPDLSGADLSDIYIGYADLSYANLNKAQLRHATILAADLRHASLLDANLGQTNLINAYLGGAVLINAYLGGADLSGANLTGADLSYATLHGTNFSRANLSDVDFTNAELASTTFAGNDLSQVKGLETVRHLAPSSIGVDTLYKSAGKIPEVFLRGCGVPDDFIAFIPSHFGIQQAIQFYSCFISYSTRDEEFARRLYSRMRDEKLRVWFAPEDAQGGKKLYEQIERAIQLHDRLLIVLSERSLQSKWVMTEIRRARKVELKENRRKLFPIRLVDYETLQAWECFDADTGEDLATEVRQYFIPDFSNWKEHDAFEKAFERLLRDLKAEEARR
jgi:hypothetical protein